MSEPSADPLKEKLAKLVAKYPRLTHGNDGLLDAIRALAAHSAAPSERQSEQFMLGRAYEAVLISEEYIDQGGYELVNKAHFDAHVESVRAAAALSQDKPTRAGEPTTTKDPTT